MKHLLLFSLIGNLAIAATYDYSVPVPAELTKFASFKMPEKATASISNAGNLTVTYCLPHTLVGTKLHRIKFSGLFDGSFAQVTGEDVDGVCMHAEGRPLTCLLKYPGIKIDEVTRDQALKSMYSGNELTERSKVVRLFGNDPAGILVVDLQ